MPHDSNGRFKKGNIPWNKGTVGLMKPNSSHFKKGYKMSEEVKSKISESMKEKNTWTKGCRIPEETKKKMSESAKKVDRSNRQFPKGEDHWNYKGGEFINSISGIKWNKWRKLVFERDEYICQKQGCTFCNNKKGVYLHPHHIKRKRDFPDLMYIVNNGITYCKDYHLKSGLHGSGKC